jgi:hypothetical protein
MMRALALTAGVLLLLTAGGLNAQKKNDSGTRSLTGVVTGADDAPVSGAVVKLENTKTQQIRSYITKEDGAYRFFELNTDTDYKVQADAQGASSGSKTLSSFDSRKQAIINLKLAKK